MATPGCSPAGVPLSAFLGYRSQPTDAILSVEKERMDILLKQFEGKIGVFYSERTVFYKQLANSIAGHYRVSLNFSEVESFNYDSQRWLEQAKSFTHLIFVGLPQSKKKVKPRSKAISMDSSSAEEELMARNHHKLSTVVVLDSDMPRSKTELDMKPPHFLDRFLHIHMLNDPVWLAQAAFAVFAAPKPIGSAEDSAYWSAVPKLVDAWKESNSLGLAIMTREMGHESPFSRIVLIKGFNKGCSSDIQKRVGKYTHIQFLNGIFLDGLPIEKVTEIFKMVQHNRVQLLVRFIHPMRQAPLLKELPTRSSTYQPSRDIIPRRRSVDEKEALPIPLFILGDNHSLQKELFKLLRTEDRASLASTSPTTPGVTSPIGAASPQSMRSPSAVLSPVSTAASTPGTAPSTPIRASSAPFMSLSEARSPGQKRNSQQDTLPPLLGQRMRRASSSLPSEFAESDDFVERAEVPSGRFKIDSIFLPDFDKASGDLQKLHAPPIIQRSDSTHPEISYTQYVLHMLKQSVDRNLSHLFLKRNGIYLIVIGLEDIVADPLIQYDNLFFWLRLIHTHVEPAEIRRIIVVGMYRRSELLGEESRTQIIQCVQHLNLAIREQMKQNYSLPIKEGGHVFIYDRDAPTDLLYLCACIQMCVEVFIDQAWYFQNEFFRSVFTPFDSYRFVCSEVLKQSKSKVVVRRHKVEHLYQSRSGLPENFWETVKIYSSAMCAEKSSDCLLQPSIIVRLLKSCTQMTHHERQVFSVRHSTLSSLPIIRAQLLNHRMAKEMHITEQSHQNVVIDWMKHLEVVYSLGKFGPDRDTFFIPFLATHSLSDDARVSWNEAVAEEFNEASVILYAKLNIHSTQRFFYQLIASLLTDVLQNPNTSPHCFVNLGCTEAIFPLTSKDQQQSIVAYPTLLRFHSIQSMIEFRTTTNRPLALLDAVEAKLLEVFTQPHYSGNLDAFRGIVSFYIPDTKFDKTTMESAMWKLGNVRRRGGAEVPRGLLDRGDSVVDVANGSIEEGREESEEDEDERYDGPEKVLLPMKFLTSPMSRNTTELKAWASSAPEMKALPTELFLEVSKVLGSSEYYWPVVAAKLDLMENNDIQHFRAYPAKGGNGSEVLQKWQESSLTYRDLANALKKVGLVRVAESIEKYYEK